MRVVIKLYDLFVPLSWRIIAWVGRRRLNVTSVPSTWSRFIKFTVFAITWACLAHQLRALITWRTRPQPQDRPPDVLKLINLRDLPFLSYTILTPPHSRTRSTHWDAADSICCIVVSRRLWWRLVARLQTNISSSHYMANHSCETPISMKQIRSSGLLF